MERMALWKLERKVEPSVNTQPRDVVRERPWTEGFLPNPGDGWPCGVQYVPIPHDTSRELQIHQLR